MKNKKDWIEKVLDVANNIMIKIIDNKIRLSCNQEKNYKLMLLPIKKAILDNQPRQISREAVEKLREKRRNEIIEWWNMVIIRKDLIKWFCDDLAALLDNWTDD